MVNEFSRKRVKLGVLYGFTAGLFFTLAAWGMDAIILSRYHASLPFLKLLPTLLICLPAAILAGYLTAKFENGLLSFILWTGLAILFTFLVINIPTKILPWLFNRIKPEYATLFKFDDINDVGLYWFYGVFAIGLTCILCGIMENLLIDQSLASSSTLGILIPLLICPIFMTGAGVSGDLLMTNHYREPLVTMETLLQNGANYYGQEVDPLEARKMRLSVIKSLDDLVLVPHKLTVVSSDGYMGMMQVLVDFGEEWALCHVVYSQPTFCEIISPKYKADKYYAHGVEKSTRIEIYNNDIILGSNFPETLTT